MNAVYAVLFQVLLATGQTATVNVIGPISADQCRVLTSHPAHAISRDFAMFTRCGDRAAVEDLLSQGGCRRNGPVAHRRDIPEAADTFWICAGEPEVLP